MKKSSTLFLLSPIFVLLLRIIVSLIFWFLSNTGSWNIAIFAGIKAISNLILGILAIISIMLFIVWIVLVNKNKNSILNYKEIINYSRQKSKKHMTKYLLWFAILIVLQLISSYFDELSKLNPNFLISIWSIIIMFLNRWIILWLAKISLDIVYNNNYKVSDLFCWWNKTLKYIIANIITWVITVVWLVLFIIPWIIRSLRLSMISYIIVQDWLWPIQAIKKSRKITKWRLWDIFIINILAWLINILWIMALFVWLFWTIPLYIIANAYIYKKIIDYWSKLDTTDLAKSVSIHKLSSKPVVKKSIKKPSPKSKRTKK